MSLADLLHSPLSAWHKLNQYSIVRHNDYTGLGVGLQTLHE